MLPRDDLGAGPAVLLLHAGIADRRMWSDHLQPLANAGWRVLALDLPGYGDAPAALEEDAPWLDVLDTIDALGVDRAALVGCSFGGAVAQRVAVLEPERVSSLVLVSSPAEGIDPSPQLHAAWEAEESALESGDIDAAVSAVVEAWTLADAPAALRELVATMQRRAFELQANAGAAPAAADPVEEDPAVLGRLEIPVLVAVGEHDMPDFHLAAAELATAIPGATRAVLAGAGHLAPLEQPETFRELLLAFLA